MEGFKVSTDKGLTIIEHVEQQLQMRVLDSKNVWLSGDTPVLEATLYVEQGGFVPQRSYLFELLGDGNVDGFRAAVDFFFNSVLGTDLYVVSIPRTSSLCPIERKNYHY